MRAMNTVREKEEELARRSKKRVAFHQRIRNTEQTLDGNEDEIVNQSCGFCGLLNLFGRRRNMNPCS